MSVTEPSCLDDPINILVTWSVSIILQKLQATLYTYYYIIQCSYSLPYVHLYHVQGEEMYPIYNLHHNVSGSVKKTTYNTTQEMLQGSQGKTYSFYVEAVNPVGVGPPSNLSIGAKYICHSPHTLTHPHYPYTTI